MKKIALISLIIALPVLAHTKPAMPGEKVSLIHETLKIGKRVEILEKIVNAKSEEEEKTYTNEFDNYMMETKGHISINLNEKIPLCLGLDYSCFNYDNAPFNANDTIVVTLSLEGGGYIANNIFSFKVNEPDGKLMRNYKSLFTYLLFNNPGIYKLQFTAQIKTNNPDLEKYYYSYTHDQFFAFTEYGNIYAPSIESLNKKLEELKEMARRDKELKEAEEQLKYDEKLKSEKNKQELESGSQDKELKEDYKVREVEESDSVGKSSEKPKEKQENHEIFDRIKMIHKTIILR